MFDIKFVSAKTQIFCFGFKLQCSKNKDKIHYQVLNFAPLPSDPKIHWKKNKKKRETRAVCYQKSEINKRMAKTN